MRTRSETIAQKTGLAPSADQLVKLCKVDETSSSVATEEEVFQRLHAFFSGHGNAQHLRLYWK